ncbi:hypothetical protein GCK72_010913 [Caenorhabditis remanei]|uniref:Uncharacterized protein n=1 Tax=Caenorhabditis remanei TaxID=31234 RepID=A0A6A5H6Y5_CAERE|nr:hypothetical protein GCK72_010913 [Caenorhabditis remanei]KAF1762651.1 hypothetical protein GCK72_010913 [Caenorhabditis remanei]
MDFTNSGLEASRGLILQDPREFILLHFWSPRGLLQDSSSGCGLLLVSSSRLLVVSSRLQAPPGLLQAPPGLLLKFCSPRGLLLKFWNSSGTPPKILGSSWISPILLNIQSPDDHF